MNILGIETSCDETAVAIVDNAKRILSSIVWSHLQQQRDYGGIVPEVSARAHLSRIGGIVQDALEAADLNLAEIDGIAATCGPGLIGGVMVGAMTGKAMASALQKPFLAVNHLMGHALTPRLFNEVKFPYLLLLVSGGHCQLLIARSPFRYDLLGTTLDDAVGEAFDKVGKMMGIEYPAGPRIEVLARSGDPLKYALPKPLLNRKGSCDFSFSGLKTAARQLIQAHEPLSPKSQADMCASFQYIVGEILKNRASNALRRCREGGIKLEAFVVAGGVAANQYLYGQLKEIADFYDMPLNIPPPQYCTDNGAMIAWAGIEMMQLGIASSLEFAPRPRWPLTELETQ